MTLGERLRLSKGHPAGFDVLRLALAAAVILQHSVNVTAGQSAANALFLSPWRDLFAPVLPMFFALSGFLVAGSLDRCRSLIGFCGLRALRIAPALAGEVAVSALLLGPALTTFPVSDYLRAPAFRSYLLNTLGLIHYRLPGVFAGNPDPWTVNAQLWTVPYELECYGVLTVLALVGALRRPVLFAGGLVACLVCLTLATAMSPAPVLEVTAGGRSLVGCFLCGVLTFLLRDRIPCRRSLFLLALVLVLTLVWVPGGSWLIAAPVCYVTVVVGLTDLPKPRFLFDGDYSYGMYLYGFPIQQALVDMFPGMSWATNATLALCAAFGMARLSWLGIERRALRWRPTLHALESRLLDRLPARSRLAGLTEPLRPRVEPAS